MDRAHSLIGIPLLGWLDQTGRSTGTLLIWLLIGCVSLHAVVLGGALQLGPPPVGIGAGEIFGLGMILGTGTAFHLCSMLFLGRHGQYVLETQLGFDPNIQSLRSYSEHKGTAPLFAFATMTTIAIMLISHFLTPGGYPEETVTYAGSVLLYGILPLNLFVAAISLIVYFQLLHYYSAVARHVELQLLRLEQYATLALPLLVLVALMSILMSILGSALMLMSDPSAHVGTFVLAFFAVLAFVLLGLGALRPVFVLRNRLRTLLRQEREIVVLALNGQHESSEKSQLGNTNAKLTRADLLTQLMYIDSLSPWAIGPYFKNLVLFGLLPPVTWAMAATVEYLMYSG